MQPKLPRLIPHEFTLRQAKRKYTARKAIVPWWQWVHAHRWTFAGVVAIAGFVLILHVKYKDALERRRKLAETYARTIQDASSRSEEERSHHPLPEHGGDGGGGDPLQHESYLPPLQMNAHQALLPGGTFV
jgi:hypothetical protein